MIAFFKFYLYSTARRARQFYKAKKTDLCDICDSDDCGESCKIKAQKRISARSEKSQSDVSAEETDSKDQSNKLSSPVTILLLVAITKILNLF